MNFEDWLRNHPKRKYLEKTIKRYIRALEKAGEWLCIELPKSLLAIEDYESFVSETDRIRSLSQFDEVNQGHGHGDLSAAMRLYAQFLKESNDTPEDTRRDQLIDAGLLPTASVLQIMTGMAMVMSMLSMCCLQDMVSLIIIG